jgi:hypothetical protein
MKKVLISILLLVISITAFAQEMRHVFKVGDFTRLALIDNVNVNYRCNADSAGMVSVTCTQEILDHLMFSLSSKGKLSIQVEDEYERQGHLPTITVYSSIIEEAENAGDSTLRIMGLPPMKAFKVRNIDNGKVIAKGLRASKLELQILSGKGKIIADGSCDDLAIRLIGTGEIQADNVKATTVTCRIMGTGNIGCDVNGGELKVSGSGTGKIYYKGQPSKVTVRKLGTIKAIPME